MICLAVITSNIIHKDPQLKTSLNTIVAPGWRNLR